MRSTDSLIVAKTADAAAEAPPKQSIVDKFNNSVPPARKRDIDRIIDEYNMKGAVMKLGNRPSNFLYRMLQNNNYWAPYSLMDYYRSEVSILATIITRPPVELLRYGIGWEPKFKSKCTDCQHEFDEKLDTCPVCGSDSLRSPDITQKELFSRDGVSFIDRANDNGQTLAMVLQSYAECQYQNNMAYTVCVTGTNIDDRGVVTQSHPMEFLHIDPKFVMMLFDEKGAMGAKETFSMRDRTMTYSTQQYPFGINDNGDSLYPACFRIGSNFGASGEPLYYAEEEIYKDNWFTQSILYGVPPWLDIEDDIRTYHFIEKHTSKRVEFGVSRSLLVFPGFTPEAMELVSEGIRDVLAVNDNSVPMIALPTAIPGTAKQEVQNIQLSQDNPNDYQTLKTEIRERLCARVGIPNLFVGDVQASGGLNNETQQITTFDRYLMDKYSKLDNQLKWMLSWVPAITDWNLVVIRPPKMDVERKEWKEKIEIAKGMKDLGFPPLSFRNGEFDYPDKPIQQQLPMGGGMSGRPAAQPPSVPQTPAPANPAEQPIQDDLKEDEDEALNDNAPEEFDDEYTASHSSPDLSPDAMTKSVRRWMQEMSPEAYTSYIAKDAYGYIRDNRDALMMILMGEQETAKLVETVTGDVFKEIVLTIMDHLVKPVWSYNDMKYECRDKARTMMPEVTDEIVDRIVKTEVTRIIFLAKEHQAQEEDGADDRYHWVGPLDRRTTAMCRYAQTGELTGELTDGTPYDYNNLQGQLPEWREDGWSLDGLKDFISNVWRVFHDNGIISTVMPTDWVMHINCRHTFARKSKIHRDDIEIFGPEIIDMMPPVEQFLPGGELADLYNTEDVYPTIVEMTGFDEISQLDVSDAIFTTEGPLPDDDIAFLVSDESTEPMVYTFTDMGHTFIFANATESEVASYAAQILRQRNEGTADVNIQWMLADDTDLDYREIRYLLENTDEIYTFMLRMGYYEGDDTD